MNSKGCVPVLAAKPSKPFAVGTMYTDVKGVSLTPFVRDFHIYNQQETRTFNLTAQKTDLP